MLPAKVTAEINRTTQNQEAGLQGPASFRSRRSCVDLLCANRYVCKQRLTLPSQFPTDSVFDNSGLTTAHGGIMKTLFYRPLRLLIAVASIALTASAQTAAPNTTPGHVLQRNSSGH